MTKGFSVPRLSLLFLIGLIILALSGCAVKTELVTEEKRIVLKQKTSGQETFTNGPLSLDFEYEQKGGSMTMFGSIYYRRGLDSLDIRVLFLDNTGMVIGRKLIYSSGYRSLAARDSNKTFRRTIEVVHGANYFTFEETIRERTSVR